MIINFLNYKFNKSALVTKFLNKYIEDFSVYYQLNYKNARSHILNSPKGAEKFVHFLQETKKIDCCYFYFDMHIGFGLEINKCCPIWVEFQLANIN